MSKKIFIHIGSHKTGTTSIQKALLANTEALQKQNLSLFCSNPDGSLHQQGNINPWFEHFKTSLHDGATIPQKALLVQKLAKLSGDVVISAEHFSFVFSETELQELKKELTPFFDEIIIIAYLRRQDQQIISHHNQTSKNLFLPSQILYASETLAIPTYKKHFDLYLDYDVRMGIWANIFGLKNIKIRLFEKANLYKQCAIQDFFHLLGVENVASIEANISQGFEKTKVSLLMNQASMKPSLLRAIISQNLDNSEKFLPSQTDAKQFYEYYKKSNKALNEKFHINPIETVFEEDFSMFPMKSQELWSEDSANKAIKNIFKSLDSTYGTLDINILIQAAIKLESSDIDLSYKLMQTASNLIPNNHLIQSKLQNYSKILNKKKEL